MKVGTDSMLLGAFAKVENKQSILDIGAGTGVLSLMLAQKAFGLSIVAVEIEDDAILDLKYNVEKSPFDTKIQILKGDFITLNIEDTFDVIISNPPFFKNSFSKGNQESRSIARNEENLTFEQLIFKSAKLLKSTGKMWVIIPSEVEEEIKELAVKYALFVEDEIAVFGKPNTHVRTIFCLSKTEILFRNFQQLTIRNVDGNYTEEYKNLTKEYHNKIL